MARWYDLDDAPALDKKKKHTIEIVIDRLILRPDIKTRLTDSLETALRSGRRTGRVGSVIDGEDMLFSQNYACPDCGISIGELEPRLFSFNNPYGACPALHRPGHTPQDRSRAGDTRPCAQPESGRGVDIGLALRTTPVR